MKRLAIIVLLGVVSAMAGVPALSADDGPRFVAHRLGHCRSEACGLADFNGDGKLDIVAGPYVYLAPDWKSHEIRKLKGNVDEKGIGYLWDFANLPLDVDDDGRVDVVSVFWDRDSAWHRNTGFDGKLWPANELKQPDAVEHAELCDIDGDGKAREILLHTRGAVWYDVIRTPNEAPKLEMHVVSDENTGIGAGVGDVNGDGRPDIVKPGAWYEAPADPRRGEWKKHPLLLLAKPDGKPEHTPQIIVYDFNGDGLPDLLTSSAHGRGIYWYEQKRQGGEISFERHLIDDTWTQPHSLVLADLNGDGRMDFVTGKRFMAHNGKDEGEFEPLGVYWYERLPGKQVAFKKHVLSYDEGIGSGLNIAVADLDGDGDLDVVVTGKWGGPVLFENRKVDKSK